ncbi:hypothetical protein GH733_008087, partial [Mirounga leonina]
MGLVVEDQLDSADFIEVVFDGRLLTPHLAAVAVGVQQRSPRWDSLDLEHASNNPGRQEGSIGSCGCPQAT